MKYHIELILSEGHELKERKRLFSRGIHGDLLFCIDVFRKGIIKKLYKLTKLLEKLSRQ